MDIIVTVVKNVIRLAVTEDIYLKSESENRSLVLTIIALVLNFECRKY